MQKFKPQSGKLVPVKLISSEMKQLISLQFSLSLAFASLKIKMQN